MENTEFDINTLLRMCVDDGVSDIHLRYGV